MKIRKAVLILAAFVFFMSGCSAEKEEVKLKDIEFTVLQEADVPEALLKTINESKKEAFMTTYQEEGYLYIARGYGEQNSGGYSIAVNGVYLTESDIVFSSELLGPSQQDLVSLVCTYPYIVVKIEFIDKSVIFK